MWPDGMGCAVPFTFDFDAEEAWIGEDPANAERPSTLSQGTYGAKWGVPLVLELLERHGIACLPDIALSRRGGGRAREGLEVVRSLGAEVTGYRSPSWDFSANTQELLRAQGSSTRRTSWTTYAHTGTARAWSSCRFSGRSTMRRTSGSTDRRGRRRSRLPTRCARSGSVSSAAITGSAARSSSCVTPHVIGRPCRLEMLEAFISYARSHGDVWMATCREIAARVL